MIAPECLIDLPSSVFIWRALGLQQSLRQKPQHNVVGAPSPVQCGSVPVVARASRLQPLWKRASLESRAKLSPTESCNLLSERCLRMIQAQDGTGHAQHCPYITEWRGRFKDAAGRWHTIEACDGHRADLDAVQRVAGSAPPRSGLPR